MSVGVERGGKPWTEQEDSTASESSIYKVKAHKQETGVGFSVSKAISRGLIMHGLIFKLSNFSLFQRVPSNCRKCYSRRWRDEIDSFERS